MRSPLPSRDQSAHDEHGHPPRSKSLFTSRAGVTLTGFLIIAGFFLVTEHTAHVFGSLPFLLLLACPLLHLFLHGGHGAHGGSHEDHGGSPR